MEQKGEKEEEKDLVAVRRQEEETALRAENDKLRSRLEEVLAGQEAKQETGEHVGMYLQDRVLTVDFVLMD